MNPTIQKKSSDEDAFQVDSPVKFKSRFPSPPVIIIIFISIAFIQTLTFSYIERDDFLFKDYSHYYSNIKNIFAGLFQNIWAPSSAKGSYYYRPIVHIYSVLTSSLNKTLFNHLAPELYHAFCNLLHILATLLIYRLLLRLQHSTRISLFAALFFGIHPALSATVAWIFGFNDILLAVWAILSFHAFLDYLGYQRDPSHNPSEVYLLLCAFYFFCGILTKESAICFIPLWSLLYWCLKPLKSVTFVSDAKIRMQKIIFLWLFLMIIWFILRGQAGISPIPIQFGGLISSLKTALYGIPLYLGKWYLPWNLPVMPTFQDSSLIGAGVAFIISILMLFYSDQLSRRWKIFGLIWFGGMILPTFLHHKGHNIDQFIFREDRLYTAAIGLLIFIVFDQRVNRWIENHRKFPSFNVIFMFIFMFVSTSYHISSYKNKNTFYSRAVKGSPHLALPYVHLASSYIDLKKFDLAEEFFLKAIEINPSEPQVHNNLGVLYLQTERLNLAQKEFQAELKRDPAYLSSYFNLGLVYLKQGNHLQVEQMWLKTIELDPDHLDAHINLVNFYSSRQQHRKAAYHMKRLQQLGIPLLQN